MSPTVLRGGGFRFYFFSREETRMHVHVHHADDEAKFWLEPQLELAENHGLSRQRLADERECFVSFGEFPWFRDASIAALCNVGRPRPGHLYWPDLDVDLATESIDHPERFPLVSKVRPPATARANKRMQPARAKDAAPSPCRRARGRSARR